jgi:glucose-1-phosphate adenylyltransferase
MAPHPHVFAMVLPGGEGERLAPLTADRTEAAVPFGGGYRLVDFVLGPRWFPGSADAIFA